MGCLSVGAEISKEVADQMAGSAVAISAHPVNENSQFSPRGRRGAVDRFLDRFSRVTTSGHFIPEIDGLRFIAISLVVLFHLSGYLSARSPRHFTTSPGSDWLGSIASQGHYGVQLFFVISGFILALPFASHAFNGSPAVKLRLYFLRRLTRLEPPYLLAMTLCFFLLIAIKGETAAHLLPHLAVGFVYLHNFVFGDGNPVNYVAWSLEIEIQFYLLVPLLARVFSIRKQLVRRALLLGTILAAMVLQWFFIVPGTRLALTIINFIQFFLLGFLLADVYLADWKREPSTRWYWDVVTMVGWPVVFWMSRSSLLISFGFPIMLFVLYCAMFRGTLSNWLIRNRCITTIGGMCYSIYLLHYQVLSAVMRHTCLIGFTSLYWVNVLLQIALTGPFLLVIAGTYFLLIEQPCMQKDWLQRMALWVPRRWV